MPFIVPAYNPHEGNHKIAVSSFVANLQEFLNELVSEGHDPFGRHLFWPETVWPILTSSMNAAWREVQPSFADTLERIQVAGEDAFIQHGLIGNQLMFKFEVIRFFNERYKALGKRFLTKLLDVLDNLLASILDAMGAGGAISEMKDFIKDSVDD